MALSWAGLAGVDEAGRGALAGPVVAAAVALPREDFNQPLIRRLSQTVSDSKKMRPAEREAVMAEMVKNPDLPLCYAVGEGSVAEVEKENVLGATRLAMARALENLGERMGQAATDGRPPVWAPPNTGDTLPLEWPAASGAGWGLMVDGLPLKPFPWPHTALVKGDDRSFLIGLASIVAKVTRDRIMVGWEKTYPGYGWANHKGYGTVRHWEALRTLGPTPGHRLSFLRKLNID